MHERWSPGLFKNLNQLIIKMDSNKISKKIWSSVSSTIEETEYSPESKTLTVRYKSGVTYDYFDVPEDMWDMLCNSSSIGGALSLNVKTKFRYAKRP